MHMLSLVHAPASLVFCHSMQQNVLGNTLPPSVTGVEPLFSPWTQDLLPADDNS